MPPERTNFIEAENVVFRTATGARPGRHLILNDISSRVQEARWLQRYKVALDADWVQDDSASEEANDDELINFLHEFHINKEVVD